MYQQDNISQTQQVLQHLGVQQEHMLVNILHIMAMAIHVQHVQQIHIQILDGDTVKVAHQDIQVVLGQLLYHHVA